jgi:hypothetical protein
LQANPRSAEMRSRSTQAGAVRAVDDIARAVFDQLSAQLGQPMSKIAPVPVVPLPRPRSQNRTRLDTPSSRPPRLTRSRLGCIQICSTIRGAIYRRPTRQSADSSGHVRAKESRTIQDLIAAAKAKLGSFDYASTGVGSAMHFSAERFWASAGMAGRADFYFCPIATPLSASAKCGLLSSTENDARPHSPTYRHRGSRLARRQLHLLGRIVRAVKNAARHQSGADQMRANRTSPERTRKTGRPPAPRA